MTTSMLHGSGRTEWTARRLTSAADLSFRVWSSIAEPSAPTVVLVHGVGMSHRSYLRLHPALARSATVHSIDLPGFAGLPAPKRNVPIAVMADALADVLRQVGVRSAVLVGHSMGAQWVVETAVRHPGLASGVGLVGPVADDRHRSAAAQAIALARDGLREPPRVNARVAVDYLRTGPRWFFAQVRHMLTYPIEERIAVLAVPALLVRGGRDPIAGDEWLGRLAARASGSGILVVPGAGHHVERTAAEAVGRGILELTAAAMGRSER